MRTEEEQKAEGTGRKKKGGRSHVTASGSAVAHYGFVTAAAAVCALASVAGARLRRRDWGFFGRWW